MLATIDPIALRLGPISIHWYAICIVSGLLLAVYLAQRWALKRGIDPENILDFILLAFPIAIGARALLCDFPVVLLQSNCNYSDC